MDAGMTDGSEFRARIFTLGLNQSSLARRMKELGDDRDEKTILRSIQRMVSADARVSGEMRALLGLMEEAETSKEQRDGPHGTLRSNAK